MTPELAMAIIASLSAAAAVVIGVIQTNLTRVQIDRTLLAAIGLDSVAQVNKNVVVKFRNYGTLAATQLGIREKIDQQKFSLQGLRANPVNRTDDIIFQAQARDYYVGTGFTDITQAKGITGVDISKAHFVGMTIEYFYPNKKRAEFGFVCEYDPVNKKYLRIETKSWQ